MKTQAFLEHHGIASNPFAEEDAQTDPVFKDFCIASTYHPTWDKIYGDPGDPSTSIVFGEKGAGKTATRLQIVRHLKEYNRQAADRRVFVIEYDDFNPFLDRFRDRFARRRKPDRVLAEWKLWDHMDAILSLGVTQLVDGILRPASGVADADKIPVDRLDHHQRRDLLLLAAYYDQSSAETIAGRWGRLRRALRYNALLSYGPLAIGIVLTLTIIGLIVGLGAWGWLSSPWVYLAVAAAWVPWLVRSFKRHLAARAVVRNVRVGKLVVGPLRQILMRFTNAEVTGQPAPHKQRTDDRYELLAKLQGTLKSLGYTGIVVLVDRVDEPDLIKGSVDQMRGLIWPLLDNKLLKHPGIGFKLLLPIELAQFIEREDRDFYQRARLDKQNMVPSLEWTGEALYDVASARLRACAAAGATPQLPALFEASVTPHRLMDAFRSLRVPRHLFKFMYRLLVAHCNAYTDEQPAWQISPERFESVLALYLRDQDAADRGLRAG